MKRSGMFLLIAVAALSAALLGASSYGTTITFDEYYVDRWNLDGFNTQLQKMGVTDLTIPQAGARVYNLFNGNYYYYYQDPQRNYNWYLEFIPSHSGNQGIMPVPTGVDLTQSITFSFTRPFDSFSADIFCGSSYTVTAFSNGESVYSSTSPAIGRNPNGTIPWGTIQISGVSFDSVQVTGLPGASSALKQVFLDDVTYVTIVPGDVDGDGHVDVVDLLYLVDAFGSVTGDGNYDARCDFNKDGSVDVIDLLMLVETFGT